MSLRSRRQHKAWGVTPRKQDKKELRARGAGDRISAREMGNHASRSSMLCRPLSRANMSHSQLILGFASLHPSLYAFACSAGWVSFNLENLENPSCL